ncbi:MAG: DUF1501 domain-containing protein [Alphaproteobacteria bacterium]|nr:DUF1501 domain-containing protein [Alphaproteobacteria bacterium]
MNISRRTTLRGLAGSALIADVAPGLALAKAYTDKRFVFVFLRGGMDGLTAVPAYGDPEFYRARGALADDAPGTDSKFAMLKLDGLFALNPDLKKMHAMYGEGELAVLHSLASPYRERSHFDAQDVMENGTTGKAEKTGWLNRALAELPADTRATRKETAMVIGALTPYVMRGPESYSSWSPPTAPSASRDLMDRIARAYRPDPLLSDSLEKARTAADMAAGGDMSGMGSDRGVNNQTFIRMMGVAGEFLRADAGARIATIDYGGWDSHAEQNNRVDVATTRFAGRFPELYIGLDEGMAKLKESLGPAAWAETVVLVVTEFGRTVRMNGTKGTDHGTGGAAFLAGGRVRGGQIIADWRGLKEADLYEGRDLYPTRDHRSVFKTVLAQHLGVAEGPLEDRIFPESRGATQLSGLLKA